MFLYNVTIGIDKDIETEWLQWVKQNYLPAMMATGFFRDCKLYRVVTHDDEGSVSYSIQVFAENIESVVNYLNQHTATIIEGHRLKFKDKHVAFNTLLEEVV